MVSHYQVALARTEAEIEASQVLRYQVLVEEGKGHVTEEMKVLGREIDVWDDYAHHIIVTDQKDGLVVGSVRLVSPLELPKGLKSYTEHYFDLSNLWSQYKNPLELSRACVSAPHRRGVALLLMWKFAMQFIHTNAFDVMYGCASFSGTDYQQHAPTLHHLMANHLSDEELMPTPIVESQIKIRDIQIDKNAMKKATLAVPTLLRGYLKIGAKVSDCVILDPIFNTTFLCIYVDAAAMGEAASAAPMRRGNTSYD